MTGQTEKVVLAGALERLEAFRVPELALGDVRGDELTPHGYGAHAGAGAAGDARHTVSDRVVHQGMHRTLPRPLRR